jgi:spore coat polysaccharide biosynthesis protein SpsF
MQLVGDRPIIRHLLDGLEKCKAIDQILLAVSDTPGQSTLVDLANRYRLDSIVGPEQDVLKRMVMGADHAGADVVIRVGTENPYIYWENVDELIHLHIENKNSLTVTEKLPLGCHVEVIDLAALKYQLDHDVDAQFHQHVTLYLADHPELFKVQRVPAPEAIQRPDIRLTVDNPEDLILVRLLHSALQKRDESITVERIVKHLESHPELLKINAFDEPLYRWK